MKYLIFISTFLFAFACSNSEQQDKTAETMASDTETVTNSASEATMEKDAFEYLTEVTPKIAEVAKIKGQLTALGNVSAEMKPDIEGAVRVMEQIEVQANGWLEKMENLKELKMSADTSGIWKVIRQETQRGQYFNTQIDQIINMGSGQLKRAQG